METTILAPVALPEPAAPAAAAPATLAAALAAAHARATTDPDIYIGLYLGATEPQPQTVKVACYGQPIRDLRATWPSVTWAWRADESANARLATALAIAGDVLGLTAASPLAPQLTPIALALAPLLLLGTPDSLSREAGFLWVESPDLLVVLDALLPDDKAAPGP